MPSSSVQFPYLYVCIMGVGNGGAGEAFAPQVFQPTIYILSEWCSTPDCERIKFYQSINLFALALDLDIMYCTLINDVRTCFKEGVASEKWVWPPGFSGVLHASYLIY